MYFLSCFKCPKNVINRIERIQRNFLQDSFNHKKYQLVRWDIHFKKKKKLIKKKGKALLSLTRLAWRPSLLLGLCQSLEKKIFSSNSLSKFCILLPGFLRGELLLLDLIITYFTPYLIPLSLKSMDSYSNANMLVE